MLSKYDRGGYQLNANVSAELPQDEAGVTSGESTNIFTDSFKAISNWFLSITGINYLLGFLNAVPAFLIAIGLPLEFAYAIGVFWHGIGLFLIIKFIGGG